MFRRIMSAFASFLYRAIRPESMSRTMVKYCLRESMFINTATCVCTHTHTSTHTRMHMHGRRKNSACPPLKLGHMGGAKICRNGNESTFRQTSMHHAGTSNNTKNIRSSKYMHASHTQKLLA